MKNTVQIDLSAVLSPDEERLINMFRNCSLEESSEFLYRLTRLNFTPWFAADFDKKRDAEDTTYMYEDLEQELKLICPRQMLGEFLCDDPHFNSIIETAWGSIAPVILGSSEQDGQRADELFNEATQMWISVNNCLVQRQPMKFKRSDALSLIESWREAVLELIYRGADD